MRGIDAKVYSELHWCKYGEKLAKKYNLVMMSMQETGETTVSLIRGERYLRYMFNYCPFCAKRLKPRWYNRRWLPRWLNPPRLLKYERGEVCYNYGTEPQPYTSRYGAETPDSH